MHANFPLFLTWDLLEALLKVEVKVKAAAGDMELKPGAKLPDGTIPFGGWQTVKNVFGAFTWRTTGKWTGTVVVERLRDRKSVV